MPKVVLISGGTSGLGKATAVALLNEGFKVSLFSHNKESVAACQAELEKSFSTDNFLVLEGDVTKEDTLQEVISQTVEKFDQIDILINNAGVACYCELEDVDTNELKNAFDVNVLGLMSLTRLVAPHMKKRQSGLIINVASIAGRRGSAGSSYYAATKFAVMGFSEGIRKELKPDGIQVATICQGMMDTKFWSEHELDRRKKRNNGELPPMLNVESVARSITHICTQPANAEIWDITIMPR